MKYNSLEGKTDEAVTTWWGMCCDRPSLWDCRAVSGLGKLWCSHLTPANSLSLSMVRHKDDGYSEEKDVKTCPRDSGYDSLSNRLSIWDRLLHTHPIWLQLSLSEEEAAEVLQSQPPGVRLRTAGKQIEASRAAASLKRKTCSSRKFFASCKEHGSWCVPGLQCREFLKTPEAAPRSRASHYWSLCLHLQDSAG